jgi:uncharacterized membrane protein YvbJ
VNKDETAYEQEQNIAKREVTVVAIIIIIIIIIVHNRVG